MSNMPIELSLSVDEIAMSFHLLNLADVGKSFLQNAYGNISASTMEEKLTVASHSLLARKIARISTTGVAVLDDEVGSLLYPLLKFKNMLQVTQSSLDGSGPDITNIYFGMDNTFTALHVHLGVVYQLTRSRPEDIPDLAAGIFHLPPQLEAIDDSVRVEAFIKMADIASSVGGQTKNARAVLRNAGLPESWSHALVDDMNSPRIRGSVVLTDLNSQNFSEEDRNQAGPGFLLLCGAHRGWIFRFENARDDTIAEIYSCTNRLFQSVVADLVGKVTAAP